MLLKIGDKTYPMTSPDRLSLLDLLMLERETRALGRPLTMATIQGMERGIAAEVAKFSTKAEQDQARENHPDSQWLLAVLLWASQRASGIKVTFEDAISFPLDELDFVPEPGDPDDPDAEGPTSALPDSGQGARPRPRSTSKRTSKPRSSVG